MISAGETIRLSCSVERGTHPEQDILCVNGEFTGLVLKAVKDGIVIEGDGIDYQIYLIRYSFPPISLPT